jgi:hypothetical protein
MGFLPGIRLNQRLLPPPCSVPSQFLRKQFKAFRTGRADTLTVSYESRRAALGAPAEPHSQRMMPADCIR